MNNYNFEVDGYAKLVNKVLNEGEKRSTRAGDTYAVFGETITLDTEHNFPLVQGRKIFYKPVLGELAAMLRGPKHLSDFEKFGCNYWKQWANEDGSINLDYGNAWRDFNGVDQLQELVNKLRDNPTDRRLLVTGWRPDRLAELSLPCCHMLYQWYVRDNKYLDMVWYQRSVDIMVGLPSNFILAAAWNIILANQCGYRSGKIKMVLGDCHVYANHLQGAMDYLRNLNRLINDKHDGYKALPYGIQMDATIDNFEPHMLQLPNFKPEPVIKFDLNG